MTYRPLSWSIFDRLAAVTTVLGIVSILLWFAFPSNYFVTPVSLVYSEETRVWTFVRGVNPLFSIEEELPSGERVRGHPARWWTEITMISDSGQECSSGRPNSAFYQIKKSDLVTYSLNDWAEPCLDAGPPFYVVTYRRVMLWGWLPLRPSRFISEILGATEGSRFDATR